MARERELGRRPVEQAFNNQGFDILSTDGNGDTYRIEVKARIEGAKDFFVTHNEVMTARTPFRATASRSSGSIRAARSSTRSATSATRSPPRT